MDTLWNVLLGFSLAVNVAAAATSVYFCIQSARAYRTLMGHRLQGAKPSKGQR